MLPPSASAAVPLIGSNEAKPIRVAPVTETAPDKKVVIRTAAVSMVMPYAVYNGRLTHPDPVLRQFGGQYGMAYYRLMMQENLGLSADCSQWEDRVNATDLIIRPGDPESEMSVEMARDARRIHRQLQNTNIVNLWITRCRWYGVTAIGKAGWKKDPETGLLAPFDLYNIDPWRFKFGPNFEPFLLTDRSLSQGVPISPRSVFFARWGSSFTAYGESDLRDIYLSCWYTQNVTEMMLHSIEVFGRPIPWIEVGDSLQGPEFDAFEDDIALQYKYYVITRTPNAKTSTTFPNMGALANGAVGRSELEFIRYHAGLISRKILGTQQTQDKVGGSRALEDTRMEIAGDKTPPAAEMRDKVWTEGYLNDISAVNWGNQPRRLWPIMESTVADADSLTAGQIDALARVGDQLRMNQVSETWAIEMLIRSGFKEAKAERMVKSIVDSKTLSREPTKGEAPPVAKDAA